MMRETHRVLKPAGTFIGTVAFLEPFHGNSLYHHTHLGTLNSLQYGGFKVVRVAPSAKWSALRAQATMGLFPRMPAVIAELLVAPLELFSAVWWQAGAILRRRSRAWQRVRKLTGGITFVAKKERP